MQMSHNEFSEQREEVIVDFMRTWAMPEYGSRIDYDWPVDLGLLKGLS